MNTKNIDDFLSIKLVKGFGRKETFLQQTVEHFTMIFLWNVQIIQEIW